MTERQEILTYCLAFPDTYQDAPFHDDNWQIVRYRKNKKAFAWTYERNGYMNVNVKVDPEWRDFWRQAYKAVVPGWHQNKEHWNTIILDGTIPKKEIKRMIAESYDLIAGSPKSGRKVGSLGGIGRKKQGEGAAALETDGSKAVVKSSAEIKHPAKRREVGS